MHPETRIDRYFSENENGPAAVAALGGCGGQAVHGAFVDEFAFHLGGHGGDHEQHLVGDARRVRAVQAGADAGEDVRVDFAGVQLVFEQYQELFHGTGDAVGFVDDKGVAGLERGQGGA